MVRLVFRAVRNNSVAVLLFAGATVAAQAQGTPPFSTSKGEWPSYTGDTRGSRYSPLDQITKANFGTLEVAWRFKTDSLGPRPEFKLESTPLMVGGVLYSTGGTMRAACRSGCIVRTKARAVLLRRACFPAGDSPIGPMAGKSGSST